MLKVFNKFDSIIITIAECVLYSRGQSVTKASVDFEGETFILFK